MVERIYILQQRNALTGAWATVREFAEGTRLDSASNQYVATRDAPDNARYRHRYRLLECTVVGEGTFNGEEK